MNMHNIPSFFFPTTVLMIDDNIEFLKSVAIGLSSNNTAYNFYSDPLKALQFLNEKHNSKDLSHGLFSLLDEEGRILEFVASVEKLVDVLLFI